MGKKRRIQVAMGIVAVLGGLAWIMFSPRAEPEPVYQGKPLSKWLEIYDPYNTNRPTQQLDDTQTAIISMGTNAIPTMLRMLRTPDLSWKNWLFATAKKQHVFKITYVEPSRLYERAAMGLEVLGPRAADAVPEMMRVFDQNPSPEAQASIARVVGLIGPEAKAAVPSLLRGAASTNRVLHVSSLFALSRIHPDANVVVPVLISNLEAPDFGDQLNAAGALRSYGTNARAAVPALVKLIESKESPPQNRARLGSMFSQKDVKRVALQALEEIDPEAAAKVSTRAVQEIP